MIYMMNLQECHQLLWNVLNYVCALVIEDSTATACESLGVTALQMLALALQDRRYCTITHLYFVNIVRSVNACFLGQLLSEYKHVYTGLDLRISFDYKSSLVDSVD